MQKRWVAFITVACLTLFTYTMLRKDSTRYDFKEGTQVWKTVEPQNVKRQELFIDQVYSDRSCLDVLNEYLKENGKESEHLNAASATAAVRVLEEERSEKMIERILSVMMKSNTTEVLKQNMKEEGLAPFAYHHLHRSQKQEGACLGLASLADTRECVTSNRKKYSNVVYFDDVLMANIAREIAPKSILDMGSGSGGFLRGFFENGAEKTAGVEISELGPLTFYAPGWNYESGPVQLPVLVPQGKPTIDALTCVMFGESDAVFDMVWSTEVFEHIPRENHCEIMNYLAHKVGKYLVVSVAKMTQDGNGHIANRMRLDFRDDWESRGLTFDTDMTKKVTDKEKIHWYAENIQVFRAPLSKEALRLKDCSYKADWLPYTNFEKQTVYFSSGETMRLSEWSKHPELERCFESRLGECQYMDGNLTLSS